MTFFWTIYELTSKFSSRSFTFGPVSFPRLFPTKIATVASLVTLTTVGGYNFSQTYAYFISQFSLN
jgi:hypothetical protein